MSEFDISIYTSKCIQKMWLSYFVVDVQLDVMKQTYCEFKNKIKILSCDVHSDIPNESSN